MPRCATNLARTLRQQGRLDEAIAEFQEALQAKPTELYNYELATTLLQARRFSEAIERLQAAAQLDPGSAEAENNLCAALLEAGRSREAVAHCERSLALKRDFGEAHATSGRSANRCRRSTSVPDTKTQPRLRRGETGAAPRRPGSRARRVRTA
jgi:tetratricopeptide (TPR) repeat protein